jgi:hypothetical protein
MNKKNHFVACKVVFFNIQYTKRQECMLLAQGSVAPLRIIASEITTYFYPTSNSSSLNP